jgi:hypothetical protein
MKIHVISETQFVMKATGVHTAFMEHIALLKVMCFTVIHTGFIIYGKAESIKEEGFLQLM